MDVAYRFLCFELQQRVGKTVTNVEASEALSEMYLSFCRLLIKLCGVVSRAKTDVSWNRVRGIGTQAARLLRVVVSLREEIFGVASDEGSALIYELARHSTELNVFYHLAQERKDTALCSELAPITEVALSVASKVDLFANSPLRSAGGQTPLTAEDVLSLIDREQNTLKVPKVRLSANFPRFVESPGQTDGEAAFFDCLVNDMLGDLRELYAQATDTQVTATMLASASASSTPAPTAAGMPSAQVGASGCFGYVRALEAPDLLQYDRMLQSLQKSSTDSGKAVARDLSGGHSRHGSVIDADEKVMQQELDDVAPGFNIGRSTPSNKHSAAAVTASSPFLERYELSRANSSVHGRSDSSSSSPSHGVSRNSPLPSAVAPLRSASPQSSLAADLAGMKLVVTKTAGKS